MGSYQSSLGAIPLANDASLTIFNSATPAVSVTLTIQDKMFSWNDSGVVKLCDGRPVMKVKGKWDACLGVRQHALNSLDGRTILSIKREIFTNSFDRRYIVSGSDMSRPVLTIRRANIYVGGFSKLKLGIYLAGHSNPLIVVKGSPFDGSYYGFLGEPKAGGRKILEIAREREMFNTPKYYLRIAPNIDTALCVAIGMYIEEEEENMRRKN
jgi:uncharacterized protein YxjI